MKKNLFLLAALALATVGTSFAQTTVPAKTTAPTEPARQQGMMAKAHKPGKSPAQKADHKAAKMAKELGLNADQENKVEQILLAENAEMKSLHDQAAGTHGMSPAMKAAHDKYDTQLKAVLTPAQFAKLQARRAEHRDERKHDHGGKMKAKS